MLSTLDLLLKLTLTLYTATDFLAFFMKQQLDGAMLRTSVLQFHHLTVKLYHSEVLVEYSLVSSNIVRNS